MNETPSPQLRVRLTKAQGLIERGKQRRALDELWEAEAQARGDAILIRELIDFTAGFEQRAEPRMKPRLAELVAALEHDAEQAAEQASPSPLPMPAEASPILRLVLSLVLLVIVAAFIWIIYGFASGSFSVFGNCGGQVGVIGEAGHWVGGSASSEWAAAALGVVLCAVAGVAIWWLRTTAVVVLAFIVLYGAALIVLALALSPVIWGPRHCVLY